MRVAELLQGLVSRELTACLFVFNPFLTQWITATLWKGFKPDSFEPHNSVKLSITNIRGLYSNFAECESFLGSNSPDILALRETNMDDWIDFGNFSVRSYLPLTRTYSIIHMHGIAVYVKEGLPFVWDLSLENCGFWIMFWTCFISLTVIQLVSYFLFLYRSSSSLLSTVFDSISSNIYEILLINPSANVFVFGDFNVHHKDWLTCSGELFYNVYISNDLTQMNIPTRIPDCDSESPVILDFFLSFDTSICSTTAFPPLRNSNHVVVSVSIDFPINPKQDSPFDCIA